MVPVLFRSIYRIIVFSDLLALFLIRTFKKFASSVVPHIIFLANITLRNVLLGVVDAVCSNIVNTTLASSSTTTCKFLEFLGLLEMDISSTYFLVYARTIKMYLT